MDSEKGNRVFARSTMCPPPPPPLVLEHWQKKPGWDRVQTEPLNEKLKIASNLWNHGHDEQVCLVLWDIPSLYSLNFILGNKDFGAERTWTGDKFAQESSVYRPVLFASWRMQVEKIDETISVTTTHYLYQHHTCKRSLHTETKLSDFALFK